MRTIWLQKPNTQEIWDLLPKNAWDKNNASPFLGIKGMGYRQEVTQTQVNTEYFVSKVLTKNQAITGTMYFQDDDHIKAFQEFVGDFRNQLHLYYSPSGEYEAGDQISAPFYKKVIITIADKTEKDETGWYLVAMTLSTQDDVWNRDRYYAVEGLSNVGNALVYPYTYPYEIGGRKALVVDINNDGREVGCKVMIKSGANDIQFQKTAKVLLYDTVSERTETDGTVTSRIFRIEIFNAEDDPIEVEPGTVIFFATPADEDYQEVKVQSVSESTGKNGGKLHTIEVPATPKSFSFRLMLGATITVGFSLKATRASKTSIEWFLDRTYVDYYGVLHENEEVQRSKWNLDLSAGSELIIDSNPLTQEAKVVYADGTSQSVVDAQEPSWEYINFIQVPTGQCRVVFYIENEDIDIKFIYREQKELI